MGLDLIDAARFDLTQRQSAFFFFFNIEIWIPSVPVDSLVYYTGKMKTVKWAAPAWREVSPPNFVPGKGVAGDKKVGIEQQRKSNWQLTIHSFVTYAE